jgi:hypothetical protein
MKQWLWLILAVITGCSEDTWNIQRSENFVNGNNALATIICLEPQISYTESDDRGNVIKNEKSNADLAKMISKTAAKNGLNIELQSLDKKRNTLYYEQLILLRNNIQDVSFGKYASLYTNGSTTDNKLETSVYVYPPKIANEFNTYSATFGTRYFSLLKVTVNDGSFLFQHVLVDTDLCETVYSERKSVYRKFSKDLLAQVVYDSFYMLKKNLVKK